MALIHDVRRFISQHQLIPPGARVVAALSGGSDSVALIHILRELHLDGDLVLAGAAHLNHQIRRAALDDERFSREVAERLELPMYVERVDVPALAVQERRSIEDAAHAARYEFFERARRDAGADLVALGHTRDDQAETFLLRLLRGAGMSGLSAMRPRHGAIVRPLLDCRRAALRQFLRDRSETFIEDASNQDVAVPRNRVRAELMPLLEARFNAGVVDVLADEAALVREAWQWMEERANDVYARAVSNGRIDVAALRAAPPALARIALRRALADVAPDRTIAFAHVDEVLRLIESGRDSSLDLPGQRVQRIGPTIVLMKRTGRGRLPRTAPNFFRYPLSIPGEVRLDSAGCVVTVEPVELGDSARRTFEEGAVVGNGPAALVRRDLCRGALAVRNRRPGDRFSPVGLGGRKKLQDFFVDRKVSRVRRDDVPLVVDETDRIVWVAGFGIDEAFRVTEAAQGVLLLKLKPVQQGVGGSA
jgi:tRNA(Ile)-lysidine synthase